jgi:hypothetical protein
MPQVIKTQLGNLINDEKMLATPLMVICTDEFGNEFWAWEPETFDIECKASFGVEMPAINRDKVWALVAVLTTDAFYKSLESFIPIVNALNSSGANFHQFDPATTEESAWAITEIFLNDPPEKSEQFEERFSHEVRRYIALTMTDEGLLEPPKILADIAEFENDPEAQAGAIIGPDEAMVQMVMTRQKAELAEINDYVQGQLRLMFEQLQAIPLRSGDAGDVAGYLSKLQKL